MDPIINSSTSSSKASSKRKSFGFPESEDFFHVSNSRCSYQERPFTPTTYNSQKFVQPPASDITALGPYQLYTHSVSRTKDFSANEPVSFYSAGTSTFSTTPPKTYRPNSPYVSPLEDYSSRISLRSGNFDNSFHEAEGPFRQRNIDAMQRKHELSPSLCYSEYRHVGKAGNSADSKNAQYWLSFFSSGVPYRILLPAAWICHVVGKGGKTVNQISQATSAVIQVVRDHQIPNLEDQIVLISGPSAESQQAGLLAMLQELQNRTKQTLIDKEGHPAVVTLIPDKAVSVVIGSKGNTINRIAKDCSCDIRVLSDLQSLSLLGHTDRVVSLRAKELNSVVSSISKIHEILTNLLNKKKLTEADFIFSLRTSSTSTSSQQTQLRSGYSRRSVPSLVENSATSAIVPRTRRRSSSPKILSQTTVPPTVTYLTPSGVLEKRKRKLVSRPSWGESSSSAAISQIQPHPTCFLKIPHLLQEVINNTQDTATLRILTPKSCASWVLGNSGARKREIESISSASIKVLVHGHNSRSIDYDEEKCRVLIIKGNPMAIGRAINIIIVGFERGQKQKQFFLRLMLSNPATSFLLPLSTVIKTITSTAQVTFRVTSVPSSDSFSEACCIEVQGATEEKITALLLILEYLLEKQRAIANIPSSKRRRLAFEEQNITVRNDGKQQDQLLDSQQHFTDDKKTNKPKATSQDISKDKKLIQSGIISTPPEATFIQTVINKTYPKVITTTETFSMQLVFRNDYQLLLSKLGADELTNIQTMINRRVGTNIKMITVDDNIQFILTGTPLGNSTAVLLLHEILIHLGGSAAQPIDTSTQTSSVPPKSPIPL